ncbi:MAG: 23S rRNA (guanosine(2251)-2'-O)-methyltransferase RlmB [Firmicutes bacterium]|nr:23S rRNA (guanosine(2251)-2'-O)-methyltransferase RlmB [Bacillota bacterium]
MIVEGKNAVMETLKGDVAIKSLLIDKELQKSFQSKDLFDLIDNKKVSFEFKDKAALDKISVFKRHQGVICIISDYQYFDIDDLISENSFIVLLDGIQDPHNFGSIIRVCECMGVSGIIISKNRCCDVTETVMRVSSGALNHVKISKVVNINSAIEYLKSKNIFVFGTDASGERLDEVNLKGNIAIVIGAEGLGMHRLTKELCDGILSIPMHGKVNSLNASVACGVVLYEAAKQRM